MLKQINGKNLVGRTIKKSRLTEYGELIILFNDDTFTVISSYPKDMDMSIIYNDLLDISFLLENSLILLDMKIITKMDVENIQKLVEA